MNDNVPWLSFQFEWEHEGKWTERHGYVSTYHGPHGPIEIGYNEDRTRTSLSGPSVPLASIEWGPKQYWPDKRGRADLLFPVLERSWSISGKMGNAPITVSQVKYDGNAEQRSLHIASVIGNWVFRPKNSGTLWRASGELVTLHAGMKPDTTPSEVLLVCLLVATDLTRLVHKEWVP